MIALAELHTLIKSLNKPEKRFFKLLAATESGNAVKAVALFDFVEKIDAKDDIYYRTEKEQSIDLSAGNIEALYSLILKSQRSFYSETITGFSISDELSNLKILFEKAQYRQCRKMLKTLKAKAGGCEKFNYLIEIIELEKTLLRSESSPEAYADEYKKLLEEQDHYIQKEKNVADYYRLYAQLKFQLKNISPQGEQTPVTFYEKFLEQPFIAGSNHALSKKSLLLLHKSRALCFNKMKMQDMRREELLQAKKLVDENELLFDEMPRHYIDILYNLVNVYLETNSFGKLKATLSEMYAILNSKKLIGADLRMKLTSYTYTVELIMLTYSAKYEEGFELADSIQEFIEVNDGIFNKEDKSVLLFNLTNFYIYNRNYVLAEKTLDKLLSESDKKARWDLKSYSRIQQLIVCYELRQYSRLPIILNVLRNLISSGVFNTQTEIYSIVLFEKYTLKNNLPIPQHEFRELYHDLKELLNNKKDEWTNFFYFNLFAYSAHKAGEGEIKDILHTNFIKSEAY